MHDDHSHDDHGQGHSHGHHQHGHRHGPHHRHTSDPDLIRHGRGHNHDHDDAEHLLSHFHGIGAHERAAEVQALTASFVEGFRTASDKASYLRVAGIPFQRKGADDLTLNLVDAAITTAWQLGTASPGFGTRELNYLPYPGAMISERETMMLTYVSLTERQEVDIVDLIAARQAGEADGN